MKLDTSVPASSHVSDRPGFDVNRALPECNVDAWRMARADGGVSLILRRPLRFWRREFLFG
jgi:hypothetical protein